MYSHKDGICLRKLKRDDLSSLVALKCESWWGTHGTLAPNYDDQLRWYETLSGSNRELFMFAEFDDGELAVSQKVYKGHDVGIACYTDIDWLSRTLNISGSIYKNRRKDGVVKAAFAAGLDFAFEILNMQRVGAEVLECNAAAQKLEIGYLGFRVEGARRRAVYKSGRYYNSVILGILREEWEAQDRIKAYGGSCNKTFDHDFAEKSASRFVRSQKELRSNVALKATDPPASYDEFH